MTFPATFRSRVHKLRLRLPEKQRASALNDALAALDLEPAGLPQSAILVLRRLCAPRAIPLRSGGAMPRIPVDWRDALRGTVSDRLRAAARPIFGAVPAACEAVLFADTAELIACFARDWLDGAPHRHWWWRELFPRTELDDVTSAWQASPAAVPAAFALLECEGRAREFVRRLPQRSAAQLLDALAGALSDEGWFRAMPPPAVAAVTGVAIVDPADSAPDTAVFTPDGEEGVHARLADAASAASRRYRTMTGPFVAGTAKAASMRRDGASDLAEAAHENSSPAESPAMSRPPLAQTVDQSAPRTSTAVPINGAEPAARLSSASAAGVPADSCTPDSGAIAAGSEAQVGPAGIRSDPAISTVPENLSPAAPAFERESNHADAIPVSAAIQSGVDMPARESAWTVRGIGGEAIDTAFGGLFYLINIGLFLGLYGDFTQPRYRGIGLSPWDFVALVGERWFGAALREDPLWDLLWQLAGHASDADIGAGFAMDSEWCLPPQWLEPFPAPAVVFAQRAGPRARLRHPAGFTIREAESAAGSEISPPFSDWCRDRPSLAAASLRCLPWCPPRRAAMPGDIHLRRWLDALVPYLEARVALALGEPFRAGVSTRLCAHVARVMLSPAHIEVRLSLATLPLSIRYAGLDRDPGWVPAAARGIRFVFE